MTSYKSALASKTWPTIDGQLTDVRLWGKRNVGGEIKGAENLIVKYNYEVNGLKYTGTSATFYTLVYPKTMEFSERHPPNSDVKVYYNPKDPAESVLIPGLNPDKPYSDLILGFLGAAIGVVIATLGWMGVIG